jgi:hypothetical protein
MYFRLFCQPLSRIIRAFLYEINPFLCPHGNGLTSLHDVSVLVRISDSCSVLLYASTIIFLHPIPQDRRTTENAGRLRWAPVGVILAFRASHF